MAVDRVENSGNEANIEQARVAQNQQENQNQAVRERERERERTEETRSVENTSSSGQVIDTLV